jgi:hypothetical protein
VRARARQAVNQLPQLLEVLQVAVQLLPQPLHLLLLLLLLLLLRALHLRQQCDLATLRVLLLPLLQDAGQLDAGAGRGCLLRVQALSNSSGRSTSKARGRR